MPVKIIDNVKAKLEESKSKGAGMILLSTGEISHLIDEIENLQLLKNAYSNLDKKRDEEVKKLQKEISDLKTILNVKMEQLKVTTNIVLDNC